MDVFVVCVDVFLWFVSELRLQECLMLRPGFGSLKLLVVRWFVRLVLSVCRLNPSKGLSSFYLHLG